MIRRFADISFNPATSVLGAAGFGGTAQPLVNLQDYSPRLGA
jgi:hypothetical protein